MRGIPHRQPVVRRLDVPVEREAVRHRDRELVRHHGRGVGRGKIDDLRGAVAHDRRLRRGERHLVLVAVERGLSVHHHGERHPFPLRRHGLVPERPNRNRCRLPATRPPPGDVRQPRERDPVLNRVRRGIRIRRAARVRVGDGVHVRRELGANTPCAIHSHHKGPIHNVANINIASPPHEMVMLRRRRRERHRLPVGLPAGLRPTY